MLRLTTFTRMFPRARAAHPFTNVQRRERVTTRVKWRSTITLDQDKSPNALLPLAASHTAIPYRQPASDSSDLL